MSDWAVPFFPSEVDAGAHLTAFEDALKAHTGAQDVLLTSSGTMALRVLARFAVPEGKPKRVILPAYGFVGTVNAFVAEGYEPILIDVTNDGSINWFGGDWPRSPVGDAVFCPVAFCGRLDPAIKHYICTQAQIADVRVIVDAAPAIADAGGIRDILNATEFEGGSRLAGLALSFSGTKLVSTGQGGAVLSRDSLAAERTYLSQGGWRDHIGQHAPGINGRMGWVQALQGRAMLKGVEHYAAMAKASRAVLELAGLPMLPSAPGGYNIVLMDKPADAIDMQRKLSSKGIESRYQFHRTINRNPAHAHIPGHFPVADMLTERALYLPYGSGLTVEQAERIVEVMRG